MLEREIERYFIDVNNCIFGFLLVNLYFFIVVINYEINGKWNKIVKWNFFVGFI